MCLLASLLVWVDAEFLRPNPPLIRGEPAPASREPEGRWDTSPVALKSRALPRGPKGAKDSFFAAPRFRALTE